MSQLEGHESHVQIPTQSHVQISFYDTCSIIVYQLIEDNPPGRESGVGLVKPHCGLNVGCVWWESERGICVVRNCRPFFLCCQSSAQIVITSSFSYCFVLMLLYHNKKEPKKQYSDN